MITTKSDYIRFLESDLRAHQLQRWKWVYRFTKPEVRFQRLLRKVEYYKNCRKDFFGKLYAKYLMLRFRELSMKLGFSIPPNVCGEGLSIAHYGTIVINSKAKIGNHCRIHVCVNIGDQHGGAPTIGDHVYIGPGAKLFGNITIADGIKIGANAVVNKSFLEPGITIVGVPAQKVMKNTG